MAGFGQNQRTAVFAASPVAPDIAVGVMPVGNIFCGFQGVQRSKNVFLQQFMYCLIKLRIAKNVAYNDNTSAFMSFFPQCQTLLQAGGDGLFSRR